MAGRRRETSGGGRETPGDAGRRPGDGERRRETPPPPLLVISSGETGRGVVSSAADPDFGNGLLLIGLIYLRHMGVYLGALYTNIPEIYSADIADDISRRRVGNVRSLARRQAF